jgi:putative ABC transport system ATP-binding protein
MTPAGEWVCSRMAEHGSHHKQPHQHLLSLLYVERRDVAVIVAFGGLAGLINLITPLAVQALVSTVSFGMLLQPLIVLSVVLVLALLLSGLLRTLQYYVVEMLQRRLFVRLVNDLSMRLPRLHIGEREIHDGSKTVNRFFDVITVQKSLATMMVDGVALVLEMTIGLVVLAFYSSSLMAFAAFLFLALMFVVFVLGRGGPSTSVAESYAKHDIAGWFEELVRHPLAFRGTHARQWADDRAESLLSKYLNAREAHFAVLLRQSIGGFTLHALSAALLFGLGGALVLQGELTLGQLVAAELIVGSVVLGFTKLGKQLESLYDLFAAISKIADLFELPVEREDGESAALTHPSSVQTHAIVMPALATGELPRTVDDITLPAGSSTVVVTQTAFGKSALLDVLVGLRAPTAGRVLVDGHDVRSLSMESLRSSCTLVRDIEIFEGTIADNLRCGLLDRSARSLEEALATVELVEDLITHNKAGLDVELVPYSGQLSRSQATRLMIARALVAHPSLLLFDGVFDGLEPGLAARIIKRVQQMRTMTILATTTHEHVAACFNRRVTLTSRPVQAPQEGAQ